jgi:hypothetical protein
MIFIIFIALNWFSANSYEVEKERVLKPDDWILEPNKSRHIGIRDSASLRGPVEDCFFIG